jgi:hypothetical protein
MSVKSDYDTLAREWDVLTEEYLDSLLVLRASTQNVLSLAWLSYKTLEAELIRRHGWTVLEFESATVATDNPRRSPGAPLFPLNGNII